MAELSPLRRRMIEDMTVRNLSPATQRSYINAVHKFSRYFGRSPDQLDLEDVHAFQVHLVSTGISWASLNQIVCALRFFYGITLGQNDVPERIPYARKPRTLPVVLSADEVVQFLEAVSSLKARVALTCAYAAGLRVGEVCGLKVQDIDSSRMVIHVRHGKGSKARYVMLSVELLGIKAFAQGELRFFNDLAHLNDAALFTRHLAGVRSIEWVVYAKPPFGGPEQVLAYLGRYTHRVAIANSRIVELDDDHVAFRWKDYRRNGCDREQIMRLHPHEFIRRFLLHVLPAGFHRMRHFGFLANSHRRDRIALCRMLLGQPTPPGGPHSSETQGGKFYECPDCRRPMRRTGIGIPPVAPPRRSSFRCDTS
jgi:hypothetical protein